MLKKGYYYGNKTPKYKNKKVYLDGREFDSKKEANRYSELKLLASAGYIAELECQKSFTLIPSQYIGEKCVERACKYVADFYYYDLNKKKYIVEDTKGYKTRDYIIKRKLMLYKYGIRITEL
ncbi:MAG: DUF1064 domain-containing protein [Methanobrevibacter sp.]|nr:DUF1064 domain-containing protein [Methanobrevibacter sp.]